MPNTKRILICPLDWGLGHATRCIPIINALLEQKAEVIIAADGRPLELLKQEFPQLKHIVFKGYEIEYPDSGSMTFKMLLSAPKILKGITREHKELEKIIEENKIDVVISDNRYGCWSKKVKSIFITHQLMIKSPIAEGALHKMVLKYVKRYNECWVPDSDDTVGLSGDLAHANPLPENAHFIGILSRFNLRSVSAPAEKYDLMAIVSGPEPQRTIFEKVLLDQLSKYEGRSLLVLGKPEKRATTDKKNLTIVSHLSATEMHSTIQNSSLIISRSGYSTIMDLATIGKKAVFIPTPGQTEQEYLSDHFMKNKIAFSQKQSQFDLGKAIEESENYSGFMKVEKNNLLAKAILRLF